MATTVYLHADGALCVGKDMPKGSDFTCAASGCDSTKELRDVMGVGKAEHVFCQDCKFKKRAAILFIVSKELEKERIKRENNSTPRKRRRVNDDDDA